MDRTKSHREQSDYSKSDTRKPRRTTANDLRSQHPTRSQQALSSAMAQGPGYQSRSDRDPEKQDQMLRFADHRHSLQRPQVNTQVPPARSHHTAQTPGKQSVIHAAPVKDLDPAADRLAEDETPLTDRDFYELMGMRPPPRSGEESVKNVAVPHGLFSKMVKSMLYTHRKYRVFAIAVYVFLILQLMISAVFIILGALTHLDTHIVIAILGAVSTVIAGGLALMQGQGLPNRLRMSRDSLRSVIFEAEELYWDMRSGRPILYKDVKKVREDYLRVIEEQKRNHPDAWNTVSNNLAQGGGRAEGRGSGAVAGAAKRPG